MDQATQPKQNEKTRAYCTAPWVEAHLYHDGQTRPCDHNQESLGNWQKNGIEAVWRSDRYKKFREKIFAGEFPNEQCRSCYLNQTTSNLGNHVRRQFVPAMEKVHEILGREVHEFRALGNFLQSQNSKQDWEIIWENFSQALQDLRSKYASLCLNFEKELEQLDLLAHVAKDFLSGNLSPKYVAPVRQVRLINKCNARCIMCAGKFNGDIINGPSMEEQFTSAALLPDGHIVSFSSETSEFLLYPKWKEIAAKLTERGLPKLRIFTNGMLMHEANARHLIEKNALETLHFSMNGATRETIESGQVNVKFDRLVENIRFVFRFSEEKKVCFQLAFSFIIMRRNFKEMSALVRLVNELRAENRTLQPEIYFAFLESNNDMNNYREFLFQEHHSLIGNEVLLEELKICQQESERCGIPITLFESTLKAYLDSGTQPPRLVCKPRDLPLLAKFLSSGGDSRILAAVVGTSDQVERTLEKMRSCKNFDFSQIAELQERDLLLIESTAVETKGFDKVERTPANAWRWALGTNQRLSFQPMPGKNSIDYKIQVPAPGTSVTIKSGSEILLKLHGTQRNEVFQGSFDFIEPISAATAKTLEFESSSCNSDANKFSADERPLAYCISKFELAHT